MKVKILTDTHLHSASCDPGHWPQVIKDHASLATAVHDEPPDVLIHLGDIGETLADRRVFLGMYNDLGIPKMLVLGNHELWDPGIDEVYNPEDNLQWTLGVAVNRGWWPLRLGMRMVEDVVFAGTCMGFDGTWDVRGRNVHSLRVDWIRNTIDGRNTRYPLGEGLRRDFVVWHSEEEDLLRKQFKNIIEAINAGMSVSSVVVCTHYPVAKGLHSPKYAGTESRYMFGSSSYENGLRALTAALLEKGVEKVYFLAGHTHSGASKEDFDGRVQFFVFPADESKAVIYDFEV